MQALRDLFLGLRAIDAPKTLIFISEGFAFSDPGMVLDLGSLSAAARTSLYAMKLDNAMFDASMARMPLNPFADRQAQTEGLEMLAGASRGTLFTVTGSGEHAVARIRGRAFGLLPARRGIGPRDRDGKPHPIRVDVPRRGATVRSRRQIPQPRRPTRWQPAPRASPRRAMAAALSSPLLSSALPLRVASFSLQGPERDKVQLLIHADIGTGLPDAESRLGGLRHLRSQRQADRHQGIRRAGVARDERRAVGASVHGRARVCRRGSTT